MKKILALMAGVALLFTSTMFTSCSDSDDDSSSSGSSSANKTGSIVGVVLDNKGEPVEGATVTLGSKTATTNYGGEFEIKDVAVNDAALVTAGSSVLPTTGSTTDTRTTAYTLTAKKDGYLSSKVTGIYVTYKEKETAKSADYQTALRGALTNDYATILDDYAQNTTNSTQAATTIVGTAAGTDVGYSQTTTNTNDISGVMTIIANALKDLESLYKDSEWSVETYADFASAALIPCDATFTGSVKLNLSPIESQTGYSEKTYIPTSEPTVRMSYTSGTNDYVFTAKVAKDGTFKFEKLPSGVTLKLTVDAFIETIENTQYYFSGTAANYILDNTATSEQAGTNIKLGSGDANEKSCVLMLYAQYDKIWIVDSNLFENENGSLIDVATPFTFTFNKEMKEVGITGTNLKDITNKAYTVTLSDDKKTATVTPIDGSWTLTSATATTTNVIITAHAADGTNVIVSNVANATSVTIPVYLDVYNYVSLVTTSYDDETSRLALDSEIKLAFSKAVKGDVVLSSPATYQYTKTWSDDRKTLTLKPATYWPAPTAAGTATTFTIASAKSLSGDDESATLTFKYWKAHSKDTGLDVYFNAYVDVSLEDASTATQEAFKIKFSKALKKFDVKGTTNLKTVYLNATSVDPDKFYTVSINDAKTEVTVTANEGVFKYEGFVKVVLDNIEAVDGSVLIREAGKLGGTNTTGTETLTITSDKIAYDGDWLKPTAIDVVSTLPASAKLSRAAIIDATTDQYLKISFNKNIYKSAITLKVGDDTTAAAAATAEKAKNYIDGKDVYVALAEVSKVSKVLVLDGLDTIISEENEGLRKSTTYVDFDKLTNGLQFRIYAALTLEDSSLVAKTPDVNGYKTYKEADPVANKTVTFTFNKELPTTYTAEVDLYSWNAKKNTYTKSVDTAKIACDGSKTVTFTSDKLLPIIEKEVANDDNTAVYTTHYLSLVVKNEAGVVLFSTKTASFGTDTGTFDLAFGGLVDKESAANAKNWASKQEFNTVKVKVAPYAITNYSLVTEVTDVAGNKSYKALPAVPAKTPLVITLNDLPAGATASYDLYLADGTKVEETKAATVNATAKTVTIASDKLVFNADKAAADTGRTEYRVTVSVKDSDGNIVFTTDKATKANFAVLKDSYEQKVFAPATGKEVKDSTDKTNTATVALYTDNKLVVKVAPLAVDGLSWVKEDTDAFGASKLDNNGKKTYKEAEKINPKAEVTITFDAEIPAGAKYSYKITDGTDTLEETKTSKTVDAATKVIKIQSDKMVAKTNAAQDYYIALTVMNGDEKIFATDSSYFGNTSNFEDKNKNKSLDTTNKAFKVTVVQTQIVTKKVENVESKTTKDDADGFKKSYKSPIVLQFSHPVADYKVVLYSSTKLYTDKTNPKTLGTDIKLEEADPANSKAATKYADFKEKAAEYIYESTAVIDDKVITITPAGYFGLSKTVNIAVFNDENNYVAVKTDENADRTYTTANVEKDYAKEILAAATTLTVDTPAEKIGDGKTVVFSVPTELSEKSDKLAVYKLYVKEAADTDYSDKTITMSSGSYSYGYDSGVVFGNDTINKNKDGVQGSAVSKENKILGRANNAFMSYALGNSAFGIRGGKVQLLVISELDGVLKAYKAELSDAVKPEGLAVSNVSNTWAPTTGNVTFTAGAGLIKFVTALGEKGTATAPTQSSDFSFDLTVDGGQIIKSIVPEFTSIGQSTANPPVASTCEIEVTYNSASTKATIAIKNGKFFKGDKIKFTVTDTTGNSNDFTFTFE